MMIVLNLIAVTLLSYLFSKIIKKYSGYIYIVVSVISLTTMVHSIIGFNGYKILYLPGLDQFMNSIVSGALGGAIFILVMYMGVMDMKTDVAKKLRMNRGELSIIGGLLTIPHNFHYLIKFIVDKDRLVTQQGLSLWSNLMMLASALFAIAIMMPLFVTSFIYFRRKMKAGSWKNLQEYAYIFYFMIYIQVMFVYLSKLASWNKYLNMFVYSLIFISYSVLKIKKIMETRYKIAQVSRKRNGYVGAESKI